MGKSVSPLPKKKKFLSKSLAVPEECGYAAATVNPQRGDISQSVSVITDITPSFVSRPRIRCFSSLRVM